MATTWVPGAYVIVSMRELQASQYRTHQTNKSLFCLFGVFDTDLLAGLSCSISCKRQAPMS